MTYQPGAPPAESVQFLREQPTVVVVFQTSCVKWPVSLLGGELVNGRIREGREKVPKVSLCEVVFFALVAPCYDAGGGVWVAGREVFAVGSALGWVSLLL